MSIEQLVLATDHGSVRVLTMNRPAARNASNRYLIRILYTALTDADADESVRAVVLTGTDPAFCAAVDLGSLGRAARLLRVSQPALSKRMRSMEAVASVRSDCAYFLTRRGA